MSSDTDGSRPRRPRTRGGRLVAWILGGLGAVVVLAVGGIVVWSQVGVYQAEPEPLAAVRADPGLRIADEGSAVVLSPADGQTDVGLVFIPGAKVDAWAYAATLAGAVRDEQITVVITRPWLNLAFFDPRPLSAFTDLAPGVDTWLVGGHSLGGVRACSLAADADALALFASYCASDLSGDDLPVLSLSGNEDLLSTPEKIADARPLLPGDAVLVEIDGAAHSSFGAYGPQDGDGTPTVSLETMTARIADALGELADTAR